MSTLNNFSLTYNPASSVSVFGTYPPLAGKYPNDSIMLDIYNFTNDYLETVYRTTKFSKQDYTVSINIEQIMSDLQYYSGKYNVTAKFLRNYLGSADGDKLVVQEISSARLEVRVTPLSTMTNQDNNYVDFFQSGFFSIDKKEVLPNLYLYKDTFTFYKVFDYVQDPFTFPNEPFSIIFKLGAPVPTDLQVDDLIWLGQEVSAPIKDGVTIIPPAPQLTTTRISGPNFDIASSNTTNYVTEYKNWDDVLSTNTETSLGIINKLFSGSLIEGIELNIDFKKFENFVHFGSAEERLRNFQYKMELIEYYDAKIYALSGAYADTFVASSSLTASAEYVTNVLDAKRKKSALIGAFDTYEKYLYYESSSYVTNSYGEFYPTTWPKQNNAKPYINYAVTSSQAQDWFNGIMSSASMYDLNNMDSLRKIIPEHIYVDPANDQYILLIDMIGHYFDLIYAYINQLTSINKRYESLTEGFAKDLVYTIGHSLGLNAENGSTIEELWSYFLGTNVSGSLISPTYGASVQDRTKEVWKRIIANLPYLLKTKGTARSIRALINCYGIPSTILRVREYGGTEPTFYSATQEEYDQFYYGLYLSGSSTSITVPTHGSTPEALEIRFRLHSSSFTTSAQRLLTGPTTIIVDPVAGTVVAGGQTISNVPLTELDTDWWTVLINRTGRAYVGTNKYGKALIYSSSTGATITNSTATIPGTGGTRLNGYVNEYRLWSQNLDLDVYENHILAPTSFQGPQDNLIVGSTSSFDTLKVRHTFGADGKKFNANVTTSIASSHPNQFNNPTNATLSNYGTNTSSYWIPQVETHYLEVIDGGPNRKVGNKIRIESGLISSSNQIEINSSILESLQDLQPVDSPRITVAFSPTDEVDEDINEQFGGYNLDDFIGDPADYYNDTYSGLDKIKHNYFKKYNKRNNVQGFIRLIQNYDSSLFQLVKQFAPERALLHTGLVVESHVLHRNKVGHVQPSYEYLHWSASIDPEPYTEGLTLPLDGTIATFDDTFSATTNQYDGTLTVNQTISSPEGLTPSVMLVSSASPLATLGLSSAVNEFGTLQVLQVEDAIDVDRLDPSQYAYYTWFHTGSGDTDWVYGLSVSEDYWNPIQPVILQNAVSQIYFSKVDKMGGYTQTQTFNLQNQVYSNQQVLNYLYTLGFGNGSDSISVVLDSYSDDYVIYMETLDPDPTSL